MRVGIAARNPDKAVMLDLEKMYGVRRYACDASDPASVDQLFQHFVRDLGPPTLLVHNIDGRVPGIFGKSITEADPGHGIRHDFEMRRLARSWWVSRRHDSCSKTTSTPTAGKGR